MAKVYHNFAELLVDTWVCSKLSFRTFGPSALKNDMICGLTGLKVWRYLFLSTLGLTRLTVRFDAIALYLPYRSDNDEVVIGQQ